jgi:hypothetical protein
MDGCHKWCLGRSCSLMEGHLPVFTGQLLGRIVSSVGRWDGGGSPSHALHGKRALQVSRMSPTDPYPVLRLRVIYPTVSFRTARRAGNCEGSVHDSPKKEPEQNVKMIRYGFVRSVICLIKIRSFQ